MSERCGYTFLGKTWLGTRESEKPRSNMVHLLGKSIFHEDVFVLIC